MTDLEGLARTFIAPLGHDPQKDWARVYVGNGFESDGSLKGLCYELARAVLTALREPSEAMLAAGDDVIVELIGEVSTVYAIGETWRAMIDAVLSEDDYSKFTPV